ncbi:DUF4124 domain-containing protein [Comamonas sp. NLF-1-9]|uniref:DUF4124 domain-containing protein n=1 Tax=Comamonas sp. NLF-1-9 TaxID=2853163 RepID=UPI001C489D92|nr:DUF4124 domain-containing protein [Comamonas sp. NLF-1-9]QXL84121.1 DUF4124 domain-containing protein [Comamonas sp. NLF-1-9]
MFAFMLLASPTWAISKCTGPDGKVVFQDRPCDGQGEEIVVRPASGPERAAVPPAATSEPAAAAAAPAPAPVPVAAPTAPPPPAAPAVSRVDQFAQRCLDWYKPLLRDPAHAYFTEPKFADRRVLRMLLHATNGFGGVVVRQAACDFDNGKLDENWTKIQAKRLEWVVD